MRRPQGERMEIIHLVEHSDLPIGKTLEELDVPRSTFYRWYQKYQEHGSEACDSGRGGEAVLGKSWPTGSSVNWCRLGM